MVAYNFPTGKKNLTLSINKSGEYSYIALSEKCLHEKFMRLTDIEKSFWK